MNDFLDNNFIESDCDDVSRETLGSDFSELVIPTSFDEALSYEQQIMYLYKLFTDYEKGVSPEVTITDIPGGHRITITDADHPDGQSFDVMDGEPGQDGSDGQDGVSPTVIITQITNGHRVTITDADHPQGQSFDVMNGEKGDKGDPGEKGDPGDSGFSPEVTITQITGGHRISITDADGTQTFDVMDGQDGQAIPPVITALATVGSGTGTPSVTVTKSGTDEAPTYTFAFDNLKGANGIDGVSPTITVRSITGGHQIEIVSAGGTERFDVMDGTDGSDGTDGVSPTVTVRSITGGHQIEIVSAGGTERFDVMDGVNGTDGSDGQNGVSPTVSTTAITDGTRVTITDAQGSHTFDVMNGTDGTDGTDGSDGISPTVTVRSITGGHQIEIVSAGGTEQFDVMDGTDGTDGSDGAAATIQVGTVTTGAAGTNASVTNSGTSSAAVFDFTIPRGANGQDGQTGPAGPGVASGGTAGQILAKASGIDYDTEWINPPSGDDLTLVARFVKWNSDRIRIYKDSDNNPIFWYTPYGIGLVYNENGGFGHNKTVAEIFTALFTIYSIEDDNLGYYAVYDGSDNQISTFNALITLLTTNFPTIPKLFQLNHILIVNTDLKHFNVTVEPDSITVSTFLEDGNSGFISMYQQCLM